MARSKGTNNFSGSLEVNAGAPLDARLVVDTQTDLTALDSYPYHYVGMTVAVKDIGELFMLIGSDPTVSANWKAIGSGSTPIMQGATIYADGKSGSAPKPFIDDRNKALFGDGHYHEIYSANQGSTVIVKVDSSAVSCKGRTCTLTDGRTTLTATIDAGTGEAVFSNVQLFGGVTVTATDADNNEAYGIGNVTYFGQYIIMLSMDVAVINLTTTDSDLFGQTLEVYKNGEQIGSSSFNILGQARVIVNEIAEYVMKAKVGNRFAKKTIVVDLLGKTYTDTIELTTLFAVHYSESNSNPDSCNYPAGYSNSEFTDPFYVNLSTGKPHWGDWASPLAKFLIPKSCMLKTDGTVDYYLDEDNNKLKLDGTASDNGNLSYGGNAMMEWGQEGKRIYWTLIPDASGKGWTWVVGDGEYDGLLHPWNHIAYDGSINYHFYLPKYKNSYVYNNKARSMTGYQPSASATRQNERTYARANNATSDVIWDVFPYADWFFLDMMCVLFSKSLATQLKFGRGFVDYTWNNKNDAKVSGGMDTKGLFYGDSNGGTSGLGVKVFGTEHPWGNGWTGITGLINASGTVKAKLCYGKADGTTVDDYNFGGNGYMPQGTIGGTSGGYIKNMNITSMGLTPKTISGSDSTYYGDGAWFNNSQTVSLALVGGGWFYASLCGAFYCDLTDSASYADARVGSALSCKPLGESA